MPPIRLAAAADLDALVALKRACFRETFVEDFAVPYPPADLAAFEADAYGRARIAAELVDPAHRTWLVEERGAPVAYCHVAPCKLPPPARGGEIELAQLYLRRGVQGRGIGAALCDHALGWAAGQPVWLGVWSGNARARAFYAARGFRDAGAYRFQVGDWLDDEVIMYRPRMN